MKPQRKHSNAMKKVLPWKKSAWKKCKPKYPKYLFVLKISKHIFLAEEEEEEQGEEEEQEEEQEELISLPG